jgi:hypothetical protein
MASRCSLLMKREKGASSCERERLDLRIDIMPERMVSLKRKPVRGPGVSFVHDA